LQQVLRHLQQVHDRQSAARRRHGFTLSCCPKADTGPNGPVTDVRLGYFIEPGRAAPVDIRAPASAHPIRLLFTSPRPGRTGLPNAS
jgi:hypothetical protein